MDGSQFIPAGNDKSVPNCHQMNRIGHKVFHQMPSTLPPNVQCCNNQNGDKISKLCPNHSSRLWIQMSHHHSQLHEVPDVNVAAKTPRRRKNDTFSEVPEATRLKSYNDREVPTDEINTAPTPPTSKISKTNNGDPIPPTRKYARVSEDNKTEQYNARRESNRIAVKKNRDKAKAQLQHTYRKNETLICSAKNINELLPEIRHHLADKLRIPSTDKIYRMIDHIELECEISVRAEVESENDDTLSAILSSAV
ncbi:hypothetical protein Ddc_10136 [Ditylenchus destructor]|nr:hypothetical protein Ddc_10136 [Ditylenchus destructor]